MTFSGIIVAAGSGSRAGGDKQWRNLGGKPVLRWSAEALLTAGADELIVVIAPDAVERVAEVLSGLPRWKAVVGGAARADSVRAGLAALSCPADQPVLIHDAARPLLDRAVVDLRVRRRPRCPGRRAPRVRREADSEKSSGGPRRPSGPGAEPLRPRDRGLGVTCRPPAGARTHTGGARRPPPARCSTRGRLGGGPTSGAQRAAPRCGHGTARADSLTSAPGTPLESCPCLRHR